MLPVFNSLISFRLVLLGVVGDWSLSLQCWAWGIKTTATKENEWTNFELTDKDVSCVGLLVL